MGLKRYFKQTSRLKYQSAADKHFEHYSNNLWADMRAEKKIRKKFTTTNNWMTCFIAATQSKSCVFFIIVCFFFTSKYSIAFGLYLLGVLYGFIGKSVIFFWNEKKTDFSSYLSKHATTRHSTIAEPNCCSPYEHREKKKTIRTNR